MFFGNPTQRPQRSLQTSGQGHESLAGVNDADVTPAGIGESKLVQAVGKHHAANLHLQIIGHREVSEAQASWRMFLRKVDLPLIAEPGTPQAYAQLQGAQHAAVPLAGIATLQLFEQGDGVESGVGLQQGFDLTVPDRFKGVLAGAPVPGRTLRRQTLRLFYTPRASLADARFGG